MSRQNYYKSRRRRQCLEVNEAFILSLVRRERAIQPRLGCRKLLHILRSEFEYGGISIGRDRFFNLLSTNNLLIKHRSRCPRTTNSRHWFGVYENLCKDICLTRPCQAVVSDITYIRTDEGFMFLSLIMDAYSRAIIGYDCSDSLEAEGALRSLSKAIKNLKNSSGVIHHSDRGIQYCCNEYIKRLKRGQFRISMTEVKSPLSGNIVDVLVSVGEEVSEDQELIILEAMKMENPIYSPAAGKVKEIKVEVGGKVERDDLLLTIE